MDEMCSRIMKRRKYSKGGQVANEGGDEPDMQADQKEREFDYLVEEDSQHPEIPADFNEHGDEDAAMDHDADMISRIMAKRRNR